MNSIYELNMTEDILNLYVEDDENSVKSEVYDLAAEAYRFFSSMVNILEGNSFVVKHPELFREILEKTNNLLDETERLMYMTLVPEENE